jgi:hypothetical protein
MIAGLAPRFEWTPNSPPTTRTIDDALEIARFWGVQIPDYVSFAVDEYGYLDAATTAKTTTFKEADGTIVDWSWLFHKRTGKIPFLIRRDILESDEAIVGVVAHEMHELENLRVAFGTGAPIEYWEAETRPDKPDNFHSKAWDFADMLVERMRGRGNAEESGQDV